MRASHSFPFPRLMRRLSVFLAAVLCVLHPRAAYADLIDLEDLTLPPESHYNGSDRAGGFFSRGAFFNNRYDTTFDFWSGWAYSNRTDVTTPGFLNQYSAYHVPSGGGNNSSNYAVAFNFDKGDASIALPAGTIPQSVSITNTTYTALSMLQGDAFAKKFGGGNGTDPDFLLLTIFGLNDAGNVTGLVGFYLADYRFDDSSLDYVVSSWTTVDLTPLGDASSLLFQLTSSDVGPFGMNTPAYFALDNLQVTPIAEAMPEPTTLALAAMGGLALIAGYVWRRRSLLAK